LKAKAAGRTTDAVVYVYLQQAEKDLLERAAAYAVRGIPGAKLPVYRFVLEAALAQARGLLKGDGNR
jgi:uncharacterized protein (DUF1778 family)